MKFETSNKVAVFDKKPHIKRGYYAGKLVEVKPRQRKDGVAIEGKYGKQIILLWEIYDEDGSEGIQYNDEDLILASVLNSEYKQDDGSYKTAFTPNSAITKVFKALGWEGPDGKEIDTSKFVGRWAVLNIDDYEATHTDEDGKEEKYKASAVKDVSEWEGPAPSDSEKAIPEEEVILDEDYNERVKKLKELNDSGSLTDEGYNKALDQLKSRS